MSKLLFSLLLVSMVAEYTESRKCPLTYVRQYEFRCKGTGDVQLPDVIKAAKARTPLECAESCFETNECESFRFRRGKPGCLLYRKSLDQMLYDERLYEKGFFYNRDCYSADCSIIKSCKAGCNDAYGFSYFYHKYACSYGHTARGPNPFEAAVFSGNLSACDASTRCAEVEFTGSFDVHYHIPSDTWRCIYFDDGHTDMYPRYPLHDEGITARKYTVPNDTVGAGYGFWFEDGYFPD